MSTAAAASPGVEQLRPRPDRLDPRLFVPRASHSKERETRLGAKRVPDALRVVTSREIKAGTGFGETQAMSSIELGGLYVVIRS